MASLFFYSEPPTLKLATMMMRRIRLSWFSEQTKFEISSINRTGWVAQSRQVPSWVRTGVRLIDCIVNTFVDKEISLRSNCYSCSFIISDWVLCMTNKSSATVWIDVQTSKARGLIIHPTAAVQKFPQRKREKDRERTCFRVTISSCIKRWLLLKNRYGLCYYISLYSTYGFHFSYRNAFQTRVTFFSSWSRFGASVTIPSFLPEYFSLVKRIVRFKSRAMERAATDSFSNELNEGWMEHVSTALRESVAL